MPGTDPIAQHYAAQRKADIEAGNVPWEDMTSAELQAQVKAAIRADPSLVNRSFSTSNDAVSDDAIRIASGQWTDDEVAASLAKQESRHLASRMEKFLAPFKDAEGEDIRRYGKDSPHIVSVRPRLAEGLANSKTDEERAKYREALAYKSEPKPGLFVGGIPVEGES
jgi:hypothetical protein